VVKNTPVRRRLILGPAVPRLLLVEQSVDENRDKPSYNVAADPYLRAVTRRFAYGAVNA
jgi:hypothetical protein